jgi:hypothetical protein
MKKFPARKFSITILVFCLFTLQSYALGQDADREILPGYDPRALGMSKADYVDLTFDRIGWYTDQARQLEELGCDKAPMLSHKCRVILQNLIQRSKECGS